jgi:uncharacterized protein YdhG (YjbR/CyaY superfamily)
MSNDVFAMCDQFEGAQQDAVKRTLQGFIDALPGGDLVVTYGMPSIKVGGSHLISVWGFKDHNSIFPGPASISLLADKVVNYTVSKGTVQFDKDKALPAPLIKAFVKATIQSHNARFPKKDGTFLEYYDNGYLKQKGKYKNGQMHGKWEWYRRDGSLMRTGSFKEGEKTGEWATFTREGTKV